MFTSYNRDNKLYRLYKDNNLVIHKQVKRLQCAGHVARVFKNRIAKWILGRILDEEGPLDSYCIDGKTKWRKMLPHWLTQKTALQQQGTGVTRGRKQGRPLLGNGPNCQRRKRKMKKKNKRRNTKEKGKKKEYRGGEGGEGKRRKKEEKRKIIRRKGQ